MSQRCQERTLACSQHCYSVERSVAHRVERSSASLRMWMPRYPCGLVSGSLLQNVLIFEFDVLHSELWRFACIRNLRENTIDPRRVRPSISREVHLQRHLRCFIRPRYPRRHPPAARDSLCPEVIMLLNPQVRCVFHSCGLQQLVPACPFQRAKSINACDQQKDERDAANTARYENLITAP